MSIYRVKRHKCPKCGNNYIGYPAISREDNETEICPVCGQREALESIGIFDVNEQDHVLDLTKEYERRKRK